tara:strand:- start:19597 stop:19722 length:126 start_codon:yes stop_codon:yes gene_type:complete
MVSCEYGICIVDIDWDKNIMADKNRVPYIPLEEHEFAGWGS